MFIYGKTSTNAIAVMSYLSAKAPRRAGSAEIAESRGISKALTAKLLTQLSSAGLVSGVQGPGGGYTLGKPAEEISLMDIARLFEQTETPSLCPFGKGWCGNGPQCPLHHSLKNMVDANRQFMNGTTLAVFDPKPGGRIRKTQAHV